jgi:hypothetical protein
MTTLKSVWNYKYHNTLTSVVEPYPVELPPSVIYKELHPNNVNEKLAELMHHADYLHANPRLKNYKPYKVIFNYNNSKPFVANIYAQTKESATYLATKKFSDYLRSSNSSMFRPSSIKLAINQGHINYKVLEI